jgi:epoxyqueuosine reductase
MNPSERSDIIKKLATTAGFQLCGLSEAIPLSAEEEHYRAWLGKEQWGNMEYLRRNFEKRLDPRSVMPESRTVIALLTSYYTGMEIPSENNYIIARYALGRDYHVRIKEMMEQMVASMKREFGEIRCMPFVDSGVLMEKAWAQQCGIGWRGKNTLLINRRHGSWFFIGIILTDLETAHDDVARDHCGTCEKCLKACPTGALEAPHVLNPLKCIAYNNIETTGEMPSELQGQFHDRIFGCDICQEVCPFNRDPLVNNDPECKPNPDLAALRKKDWEELSSAQFEDLFRQTSVIRTSYETLMRNIRFISGK